MRTTLTLTNTTRIRAEDPLSIVFDDPLTGDQLTLMVSATSIVQRRLLENLAAAVWKLLQPGIDSLELDRRLGYDDKIAAGDIRVGSQVYWPGTTAPGYPGTVSQIHATTGVATVDRPDGDGKFVMASSSLRLLDSRDRRYRPAPDELAAGDHFAGMPDQINDLPDSDGLVDRKAVLSIVEQWRPATEDQAIARLDRHRDV